MEIEEIQRSFLKKRNLNEIADINFFLNNKSNNIYDDLNKHISILENENENLSKSKSEISKNKSANDLNDLFDKIDQKVQQQDWNKLPNYIQKDKIREYVNMLTHINNKNNYYKQILDKIKSKSIKRKDIIYNVKTCRIEDIIMLT